MQINGCRQPRRRGHVVVEDQVHGLAAEFEEGRLHGLRGGLHDASAGRRRSGERHHVDQGRRREHLSDKVIRRGDDVDDAGRNVGVLGDDPPDPGGVPRRVRGGLEHEVLPIARMGPILLRMISNGKFHGSDDTDDADRLLPHLAVAACPCRMRLFGSERFQWNSLIMSAGQRSASFSGTSSCGPYVASTGQPTSATSSATQVFPLGLGAPCNCRRPAARLAVAGPIGVVEGVTRRRRRRVHVRAGTVAGAARGPLGGRVDVVELSSGLGLDQLAVDEHPRFVVHHCRSSFTASELRGARVR